MNDTTTCTQPALRGRYAQLAADLRDAADAARLVDLEDDGGTCNFDSMTLYLPRWKEATIHTTAEAAEMRCWKHTQWGLSSYVFSVPVVRQGNARTRQAKAMSATMKAKGYHAGMYYQMD